MAKTRATSVKNRRSSGKLRADGAPNPLKPLQSALEVVGRKPHPLEPAVLLEQELVLQCPAVVARAGLGASVDQLAQAASDVLREIITKIRDETDLRVAEVAFAIDKDYEGKQIGERQNLLHQRYGITKDMYATRRKLVFSKIAYKLSIPRQSIQTSGIVALQPSRVGPTATCFYYASIATKLLIARRRDLLGNDASLLHEPNLSLYSLHVTFLLTAHRYLHTMNAIEDVAKPELTSILQRAIANGPLQDIVYLAHIYGGLDWPHYSSDDLDYEAHRWLCTTWKAWYERQETSGAEVGTELHALTLAVIEFRNTLPTIPTFKPSSDSQRYELYPAVTIGNEIFRRAVNYTTPTQQNAQSDQSPLPKVLSDVLDTPHARDTWLSRMEEGLNMRANWELRHANAYKRWDELIAERLYNKASYDITGS